MESHQDNNETPADSIESNNANKSAAFATNYQSAQHAQQDQHMELNEPVTESNNVDTEPRGIHLLNGVSDENNEEVVPKDAQTVFSSEDGSVKLGKMGQQQEMPSNNQTQLFRTFQPEDKLSNNPRLNKAPPILLKHRSESLEPQRKADEETSSFQSGMRTFQPLQMQRMFTNDGRLHSMKGPQLNRKISSPEESNMQLQNLYYKLTGKWGDAQLNEMMHKKFMKIATDQKNEIMDEFGQQYPEIMTYIKHEQYNNSFAIFWSKLLLLVFVYNFFTSFWMIGFPGFPEAFWFNLEVTCEIISVLDLVIRITFPLLLPSAWQVMFLLHDRNDDRIFLTTMRGLASIPSSMIFEGVFRNQPAKLKSFWIAIVRLHKIFRFRMFSEYFDTDTKDHAKTRILHLLSIIFSFFMGLHFLNICFIIPGRFQDDYGWFKTAGYFDYPDVSNWYRYLDAFMYVISNMSGMGFGNIVPLSNGEWFSACFIFTIGCSVYLRYFADFTTSVQSYNQSYMENHLQLEKFKKLAEVRHLPENLRAKIRYYFKNLRVPFEEFKRRNNLVSELPASLKEELSLLVNQSLIHGVKFFQFCSPDFIMKICRHLKPHICIINEHVFYRDSAALRLFFVNEGVCEVVASNEKTLIRFMSKGSFFGEIGCLLTGKRTCSVIVRTTTILHAIRKEPLMSILEEYPSQHKYLRAVGRQRIEKVHANQVDGSEEAEKEQIVEQVKTLDAEHTVFGKVDTDSDTHANLPLLQTEFIQNMQILGRLGDTQDGSALINNSVFSQNEHFTTAKTDMTKSKQEVKSKSPRLWQTKEMQPDYFLIIPLSPLFLVWNAIMAVVIIYDIFMVSFQVFFEYRIEGTLIAVDIICYCLLAIDMFMRAKTAITSPKKFCFDPNKVFNHYLNDWMLLDIVATFPVCYFLMLSPSIDAKYAAWARLPRLLKIARLNETIEIFKWNSDVRIEVYRLLQMFLLYGLTGHVFACGFRIIGQRDYNSNRRFDSMTLYKYSETRPQLAGIIDSMGDLNPWQMYAIMFYFGIGLCGACPYGDMIPYTPTEEIFDIIGQAWVRLMWAVIIAECVSYVGSLHEAKAQHDMKRDQIITWLRQQQIQGKIAERYKDYESCMWENFQGIEEEKILKTLPRSLRLEIRSYIFKNLIENWEAFPRESQGTVETVIRMLHLVVYPAYEYIITAGEIAEEMYFIIKGVVEIRGKNNDILNTLKQGQNFGEMALLDPKNRIRMANAVSLTMVTLAVLTKANFDKICLYFPSFHRKIEMMVLLRKNMNARLAAKALELEQQKKSDDKPLPKESHRGLTIIHEADSNSAMSESVLDRPRISARRQHQINVGFMPSSQEHADEQNLLKPAHALVTEARDEESSAMIQPLVRKLEGNTGLINIPLDVIVIQNMESSLANENLQLVEKPNVAMLENQSIQTESFDESNLPHNEDEEDQHKEDSFSSKSSEEEERMRASLRKRQPRKDSISAHFQQIQEQTFQFQRADTWLQTIRLVHFCVSLLCFYNLVFIPIQFGFRIKFRGIFLAMEVLTIIFYLAEVVFRIRFAIHMYVLKSTQLAMIRSHAERVLLSDQHQLQERLDTQKQEIIITLIAAFPVSLIIAATDSYEPFGWLLWVMSIRLIKVRPVFKFWRWAKTFGINQVTLAEVIFYYYFAAHWFSGAMIGISLFQTDQRDTWLRRLPSPSPNPIRLTPNVLDDISRLQLYNYALYFQVNTLSNLTVGDISPISFKEKFLCAFNIWIGTFVYNFLYANIAAVVQFLVSGNHIEFFSQYNITLQKIQNGKVTDQVINSVRSFFDYIWFRHRGVNFNELRKTVPVSLATDMSLTIYGTAIERSLLFCDKSGQIDIPLSLSVFKQIEFKQFLASDFLVKVGQLVTETYILLEGELRIYGLHNDELLGVMTIGSHFGIDLSQEFGERDQIRQFDQRLCTGFKMDYAADNFDNRSIVNIVANSIVTVGVIHEYNLELLYQAFPQFKQRMQFMNRVLFQLGKLSLEKHTEANKFENNKMYTKNMQLDNITHCTQEHYGKIIDSNLSHPNNQFDLHMFMKNCCLKYLPFERDLLESKQRVLKPFAISLDNFDSKGNLSEVTQLKLVVQRDSMFVKVMKCVQLINLLYIAFTVPFEISFDVPMGSGLIIAEIISLLVQAIYMGMILRTPVMLKSKPTLRFMNVLNNYYHDGLIIDLLGLLPLNLILGATCPQSSMQKLELVIIVSFLRFLRVFTIWRGLHLIQEFTVYLRDKSYYIILIQALVIWFIQGHVMACSWVYLTLVIERDKSDTWFNQQLLPGETYAEQYLRSYYFSLNIATGIGSGDMIPQNDLERFCMQVFMTVGDVIWVFGFGLIWSFWGLKRQDKKTIVHNKIKQLQDLMDAYSIEASQKQMMEKYFAYEFYLNQRAKLIDTSMLSNNLPTSVVQQIVVQTNEQIFKVIFKDLNSENLIRELCTALKGKIYLPLDMVVNKGDIAHEIFFIVDGTVHVLASDKNTIAMTLQEGEHFGEIEVLGDLRREFFVQAVTFCTINSLSKYELESISAVFPQIITHLEESAAPKKRILEKFNLTLNSTPFIEEQNQIMGQFLNTSYASKDSSSTKHALARAATLQGGITQVLKDQLGDLTSSPDKVSRRPRTDSYNLLKRESNMPGRKTSTMTMEKKLSNDFQQASSARQQQEQPTQTNEEIPQPKRRLSEMSISRHTMQGQNTGLKLQWNVHNSQLQKNWL